MDLNIGLTSVTVGILLILYGGVMFWYIATRRQQTGIQDVIRKSIGGKPQERVGNTRGNLRYVSIDKQASRKKQSIFSRIEGILNIDEYEAQYYTLPQFVLILIGIFIALLIEIYCFLVFGLPVLFYEFALPFVSLLVCRKIFGDIHARRRNGLFNQLPDTLDRISRSISVGVSMSEALRNAAAEAPPPTAIELTRVFGNISVGVPVARAIQQMAKDNKLAEYRFVATAITLQSTVGGSIGKTLENVSEVIRSRVNIKKRGVALTGESRASATILTFLPIVTVLAIMVLSPKYGEKLIFTADGRHYLGVSVAMILVGRYIMNNMLKNTLESIK